MQKVNLFLIKNFTYIYIKYQLQIIWVLLPLKDINQLRIESAYK